MSVKQSHKPDPEKQPEIPASEKEAKEEAERMREEEDRLPVNPYPVNQESKR